MKLFLLWIFIILATLLSACSQDTPSVVEPKDFANVCDDANKGKLISTEGYLRLPQEFTGEDSVVLRLYESDGFDGDPVGVQVDFGEGANQLEMVPIQYSDTDLKVHLTDGSVAEFGTEIKVSGKVYFPLVSQEFDCALENPSIELP